MGRPYQCWRTDLVTSDRFNRRKICVLPIVDNVSLQCGAVHVDQSLKGEDVMAVVQRLHQKLGLVPGRIQVNTGSEFIGKVLNRWA